MPRPQPHRGALAVLSVASACALACSVNTARALASEAAEPAVAPYMEMAGPNVGNLSKGIDAGLSSVTAAFVIGDDCTPIWDDGSKVANNTGVSAAIADAQGRGVDVIVSFGGAGGLDLARSCTNLNKLTTAYQSVIVKFGITRVDFDVEGEAIDPQQEKASIARRFAAIRQLQEMDPNLVVSTTIGVGPSGLVSEGLKFLKVAKKSGTPIDLVNIMTMDYGGPVDDMGALAIQSAQGTLAQLQSLWPSYGYANLGVTPMIGQNDSAGEVTELGDAETIAAFARANGVGRLAFWSLNRDQRCAKAAKAAKARNNCSGVKQAPVEFTTRFLGSP